MGDKLVATVRFNTDGVEAELYQKIQQGKQAAGLSVPEYMKAILLEYFEKMERQKEERSVLQEIRGEYREMVGQLEKVFRQSLQEHDAVLLGAINRLGAVAVLAEDVSTDDKESAKLPETSEEIPAGVLDFLESF